MLRWICNPAKARLIVLTQLLTPRLFFIKDLQNRLFKDMKNQAMRIWTESNNHL